MNELTRDERSDRWRRLSLLLEPIHRQALGTARGLSRSDADGDGIYQDAVIRAFEKLSTLKDESSFKSWFFAVLVSVHRNRYRRSFWKRFRFVDDDTIQKAAEIDPTDTDFLGAERMRRALSMLSNEQREAVVLFEIEGFTIEEIGQIQKASVPAVKSRLTRGRVRLRGIYEKSGHLNEGVITDEAPRARLAEGGRV